MALGMQAKTRLDSSVNHAEAVRHVDAALLFFEKSDRYFKMSGIVMINVLCG